jgi:hypothetical protein
MVSPRFLVHHQASRAILVQLNYLSKLVMQTSCSVASRIQSPSSHQDQNLQEFGMLPLVPHFCTFHYTMLLLPFCNRKALKSSYHVLEGMDNPGSMGNREIART